MVKSLLQALRINAIGLERFVVTHWVKIDKELGL